MKLNEKITKLRKQKGMSQEALADKLAVSRQAVSKWETGESLPDMDNIAFLCKEFNVSADFLLNDSVENPNEFCVLEEKGKTTQKKLTGTKIALICVSCVLALVLIFIPVYTTVIKNNYDSLNSTVEFFKKGDYISNLKITSSSENIGTYSQEFVKVTSFNVNMILKEQHLNCTVEYLASYYNLNYNIGYEAKYNGTSYSAVIPTEFKDRTINLLTLQVTVGDQIFTTVLIDIYNTYGHTLQYNEIWNNND